MGERKNIKRNANRVKAKNRPFHQSIQKNYNKKKREEGNNKTLF